MIVDRINGKLSYMLNEQDLGVAFYSESLTPGRYFGLTGLYNSEDEVEVIDWSKNK